MSNEQNNNPQQNEEVVSILKRLSELLDNSVSLEDAIAMAKQQKVQSLAEDNFATFDKQDNTKADNGQLSFDITDESVKEPDEISALDYIEPENTSAEPDKPLLSNDDNELIARLKSVVHGTPAATVDETVAEQTEEVVAEDTAEETVAEQPEEVVAEDTAEETVAEQTEEVVAEDTAEETAAEQTEEVVAEDTAEETAAEQTDEVAADTNTETEPDKNEGGSKVFDELWAYLGNRTAEKNADITEETREQTDTEYKAEEEDIQLPENEDDYSEETEEDLENGEESFEEIDENAELGEDAENIGEENSFIPDDHTVESDAEDDLFSSVFTDERTERKNKEKDRRMWQKQTDGSAILCNIFDWLEVVVLSAAFALLLFTFILRLAVVDGDSMNHTLHDKELLIISDLMYTPDNGDIVVFTSPNYPEPIVKRVIATEGQTVDIDFETWTVTVDGEPLKEDYINKVYGSMDSFDMQFPLTVKEGHVFVMGDNRNESLDSRNSRIGLVDVRNILGEVKIRLFPFDRFGKVD